MKPRNRIKSTNCLLLLSALSCVVTTPALSADTALKLASESVDEVNRNTIKHSEPDHFKDGWAEGKIEAAFLFNEKLNSFKLDSEVVGNTAILTGEVDSQEHKALAHELALDISDIKQVDNRITIAGDRTTQLTPSPNILGSVRDAGITASIKFKYLVSDDLSASDIQIETRQQVVTLTGEVENQAQKALAETIAQDSDAVETVRNRISVQSS